MKILTYSELKSKSSLLPLMEQSFGWVFNPTEFDETIKTDPRLRGGCVGFCAIDNREILGFVGVMDLRARLLDGTEEQAGGIYGVATSPEHARRGVCTTLMKRAHEYFKEKGCPFVFLTTSPTIVAYALYKKLGYFDVTSFPSAYKIKQKGRAAPVRKNEGKHRVDFDRILKIYSDYTKAMQGFVVRDRSYLRTLFRISEIAPKECLATGGGYVVFKKGRKQIFIRELIAKDQAEMNALIGLVENQSPNMIFARGILDPRLLEVYKSRGFMVLRKGHGVLMVKEMKENISYKKSFGHSFFMTSLDHF